MLPSVRPWLCLCGVRVCVFVYAACVLCVFVGVCPSLPLVCVVWRGWLAVVWLVFCLAGCPPFSLPLFRSSGCNREWRLVGPASYLDVDQSIASQFDTEPSCKIGHAKRARTPYFRIPLRLLPRAGHNFFTFAAESRYEQAGPETNVNVGRKNM